MDRIKIFLSLITTAFLAVGCNKKDTDDKSVKIGLKAKDIYTTRSCKMAFSDPWPLSGEDEEKRAIGRSFFTIPWVEAPSATTARDGLGPLFSANTCMHCHPNNGAGVPVDKDGKVTRSLVMRLSIDPKKNRNDEAIKKYGFIPEPTYGGQLSLNGTSDTPYEGVVRVSYKEVVGKYDDGEEYVLRHPTYTIDDLQYGPLHKDTNIAPHIALALVGLGAIEMIDKNDILAKEDINDSDGDGISGKANWVFNPETNTTELGRFTWKAASATVKQQVANAAHNDMGLSNPLYPGENCTDVQEECLKAYKSAHEFDLPMNRLDAIAFYVKTLKIPTQRKSANFDKGKEIFNRIGCASCHTPSYRLKNIGVTIHPYSDFLLHDMGDALSDGHTIFKAEPNEFRTPPLWGIGLYKKVSGEMALLHDGRARSIEEAILWHGGEALQSQLAFKALSKKERDMLVEFLKGI